jgi:Ca2+-binding RTX toxin-like protein
MAAALFAALSTLNLGTGTNVLSVLATGDISALATPTVTNVTTGNLTGTGGDDVVTLTGAQLNAILVGSGTINLGAGTGDTINLTSTSTDLNTLGGTNASIAGVETISAAGAAASVTITLSSQTEGFTIIGSGFNDTLTGGSGTDIISGGAGNDTISGGGGTDQIRGGAGADNLTGGGASDILLYDTDTIGVIINLSANTASGGDAQGDTIVTFENVYGGSGSDTLTGTNNANILYGNNGNDIISGGGGADTISGGAGSDTLTGGNGGDTFIFDSFTGTDTITDYKTNQSDTLDISNLLTGFTAGVSDIDNFCQFQVSGGNTTVRIDVDGTANGANFVSIATLTGITTLVVQTLYDNGQIIA